MDAYGTDMENSGPISTHPETDMDRRPNILLLQADQLAPHFLPVYGHPVTTAPHLSKLAREGTVFDAAYCNSPLCAPSRLSMLTGLMPSDIGAYDNASPLSPTIPTFAHHLRLGGYRTVLAGKMHLVGPDQLHGFEERLTTDIYPADFGWTPDWDDPAADPVRSYLRKAARDIAGAGVTGPTLQMRYDDEVTHRAVQWLRETGDEQRPFLLTVSYTHPHDPFTITAPYWDRYEGKAIDDPVTPAGRDLPPDGLSRQLRAALDLDHLNLAGTQVRAARRAYYAAIGYLDDNVGRVLATLRELDRGRPTVVVFMADHGEMLGERGLWFKMCFFERAARIPMIISGAGPPSQRIGTPVSLIDLLPTLLEIAGLDPHRVDTPGRSLAPMVHGEPETIAPPVFGELLGEGVTDPVVMIRDGPYKYISMLGAPALLFDVIEDPEERSDLAGIVRYAEVERHLAAMASSRWDLAELRADVVASQRQRRFVHRALTTGKHTPWDYSPMTDGAASYVRNV